MEPSADEEALRATIDTAFKDYADDHYPRASQRWPFPVPFRRISGAAGVCQGRRSHCLRRGPQVQPQQLLERPLALGVVRLARRAGRAHGRRTLNKATGAVKGVLKVQVHYYEDGNVQLVSQKKATFRQPAMPAHPPQIEAQISVGDDAGTAKELIKEIGRAENEYQARSPPRRGRLTRADGNCGELQHHVGHHVQGAAPRAAHHPHQGLCSARRRAAHRLQVDWLKILNYKVGKELASK